MITSETFYQARCDADGCAGTFPGDDDDEGASHYPMDSLVEGMAEERGEFDEHWTVVGEKTYCPRHAPGNIDCTNCGGEGYIRNPDAAEAIDKFTKCERCDGRGYVVKSSEVYPA